MARQAGDRLKLRTRITVLHKSGDVEVNCQHCGGGVVLGQLTKVALTKSTHAAPRFVVPRRT